MRLQPLAAVPVLLAAAGLWLAWPWLAALWFPVSAAPDHPDLLVVLDGAPSPSEHRKLLRDALRLTLWRATGSTGAWLVPDALARKRADFGV